MKGQKKRAAKSDSLISKSRNNHPEEVVVVKQSFAALMSVHWAKFYDDSGTCQGMRKTSFETHRPLVGETIISFERSEEKSLVSPMRMI